MRIAVIADTHDRFPAHLGAAIAEADEIWHLGDVCAPTLLDALAHVGPPIKVVRGNCDDCLEWPLTLAFELEGFAIVLMHIPPRVPPPGAALLLHGHTHVPRNEIVRETRFLNPGCITRPNRGAPASYGWLELQRGKPPRWNVEPV